MSCFCLWCCVCVSRCAVCVCARFGHASLNFGCPWFVLIPHTLFLFPSLRCTSTVWGLFGRPSCLFLCAVFDHKRGGTRIRSRSKSLRDGAINRRNSCSSIVWKTRRRQLYAKRTTSFLLSFQGYPPVLEAIRRKHRHRRTCRQQVQPKSEVTN